MLPGVSILVILDVPLKRGRTNQLVIIDGCFNPCYSGCSSETPGLKQVNLRNSSFNPCYSGCSSETVIDEGIEIIDYIKFQSLLFWMFL
mgnify:CR=1 FL=1